jgi:hypothetical protein
MLQWCSFLGAWLLVAGSLYQATLELREQNSLRDEIMQVIQKQPVPPPVSAWWWLLPPVRIALEQRRWQGRRVDMMGSFNPAQRKELVQYMNKTTGWLLVGVGGFLLAVKETWELTDHYDWPVWVPIVLVIAAVLLSLSFSAAWLQRSDRMLAAD